MFEMNKLLVIFILSFLPLSSFAQFNKDIPFLYLTGNDDEIMFRGLAHEEPIFLMIQDTNRLNRVIFNLAIYNNNEGVATRLILTDGKQYLSHVELGQLNHYQFVRFDVPLQSLPNSKPNFKLRIVHSVLNHDQVKPHELLTVLNQKDSYYRPILEPIIAKDRNNLNTFNALLRGGYFSHYLTYLHPLEDATSEASINGASKIVQGLTLRTQTIQENIRYGPIPDDFIPGVRIIFGTTLALRDSRFAKDFNVAGIKGPFIGVTQKSDDCVLLLITGTNQNEVLRALTQFTLQSSWLDKKNKQGSSIVRVPSSGSQRISLDNFVDRVNVTFSSINLRVFVPSNLKFDVSSKFVLNLMVNHERLLPSDAMLVLRLNGVHSRSELLHSSWWRASHYYRLELPLQDFKKGLNTIQLKASSLDKDINIVVDSQSSTMVIDSGLEYIPLQTDYLRPESVLAVADGLGRESQISIPRMGQEQLNMLWYFLSHITLDAQKTFPDNLITFSSKKIRRLQVILSQPNGDSESIDVNDMVEKRNTWKQKILDKLFVFGPESSTQPKNSSIKHNQLEEDGYVIKLDHIDIEELKQFLSSTQDVLPTGKIRLGNGPQSLHEGLKFIVLVWPYVLSGLVISLVGIISFIIYRKLERRA